VDRIANTTELQDELRRLLAYAQSQRPSRSRIATALNELAHRTASSKTADLKPLRFPSKAYNITTQQIIDGLRQAAENLYACRGYTRAISDMLQDQKEDMRSMGAGPLAGFPDAVEAKISETKDSWYKLDWAMGSTASLFESLAQLIHKSER